MLELVIAFFTLKVTLISLSVVVGIGLLYLAHKVLGTLIGKSILPVQGKQFKSVSKTFAKNLISDPKCKSKIVTTLPENDAPSDRHIPIFVQT